MGTPRVAEDGNPPDVRPTGRVELPYLDGIRGLAALAVVLYHSYLFTGMTGEARTELPAIGLIMGWGYLGVPVFIVLSGYVLMLPLLRTESLDFPGGVRAFVLRRARRILPPYYAALVVSLGLIALIPVLQRESSTQWDSKVPVTLPDVLSHLFLVHDASADWVGKINGPLWSVAVEWQIYFLMPLLLVPMWRRLNPYVVVVTLTTITIVASVGLQVLPFAHPWFIALFAMGMLAAQKTLGHQLHPWQLVSAGTAIVVVLALAWTTSPVPVGLKGWPSEMLVGVAVATALVILGRRSLNGRSGKLRSLLQTRPLIFAGTISYSVYLMHSPLLGLANLLLLPLDLPIEVHWVLMTFVAAPTAIAFCYVLFLLVERNFLNTRQRHAQKALSS
jgi:peptidoglycan/LPS O-acetylase OafA/YrhL